MLSLPAWKHGLKSIINANNDFMKMSLPAWKRGLKFSIARAISKRPTVASCVEAWIEIDNNLNLNCHSASLPAWKRGLK